MVKGLSNIYFVIYTVVICVIYSLLKKEGGMAMGVLIIFLISSVPFILINLGRNLPKKKRTLVIVNIVYITLISILSFLSLDKEDWLIVCALGILLVIILIVDLVKKKDLIVLNYFSFIHLLVFLIYLIS
jgi:hypothetical protein